MSTARSWLRDLVRPPYGASLGALVLVVACAGGVVLLHAVRPDLDPLQHVLSEHANGPFGIVMTAVFYGVGLACVALGWRLRTALRWGGVAAASPLADRTPWPGAAQRVLAGTVVAWLLLTVRRVRTVALGQR